MDVIELKLTRIGNSRGVRLPAQWLRHYRWSDVLRAEARLDGLLLQAPAGTEKLSWTDTAHEMASSNEDWSDWEAADADGLGHLPWTGHAAPPARHPRRSRQRPRR